MKNKFTDRALLNLFDYGYYVDSYDYFITASDAYIVEAGFKNEEDIVGKTPSDMPWGHCYPLYKANNYLVKKNMKSMWFVEPLPISSNKKIDILSVKAPVISLENKMIGISGIGISVTNVPFDKIMSNLLLAADQYNLSFDPKFIMQVISQISQSNNCIYQWPKESKPFDYGHVYFTLREAQILHYLFNHYSAEKTAEKLEISKKTVEYHLANIKVKLNCLNKSQIVNKAVDWGFIDLMFMKF